MVFTGRSIPAQVDGVVSFLLGVYPIFPRFFAELGNRFSDPPRHYILTRDLCTKFRKIQMTL